jgi:putative redox protein
MELIAIGLAGCTGMDVISILQKKRQVITAFEVEVHTKLAEEHPRVFTEAEILYRISGENVQEKAVVRAIELSGKNYCPVHAMLGQVMPIILKYQIYEHKDNVETDLVVSGACDINLDP